MIKRFNIAILVFAAVLAGCTKTQVATTEKAVSFQVGSYAPQTKAPEGTASIKEVDGITSFSSRGFLHAEGITDPAYQEFFGATGETISYHAGTPATWTPSHDYYWPKSANSYINFISWVGGTPAITYSATDGATFAWNNVTVATTDNLLWADMAWRYNANAQTYQFDDVEEGVPTLFHHALAQVKFQGRASKISDTGVTWSVTVNSIELVGVKNKGSLSLSNSDLGSKGTKVWTTDGWGNLSGEATIGSSPDAPLSTSATALTDWNSVIPQAVTADMVLTVNYSVTTTYGTAKTVTEPVEATVALNAFTGVTDWEMNKRITYTIVINPDTNIIKIIPVETDWVTEAEKSISIE